MINHSVKKTCILVTLVLTLCVIGTRYAQAGPGTLATEAGVSPSGGTFYANSPSGWWTYTDAYGSTKKSYSGTPLRKFVDSLPGLGSANCVKGAPSNTNSCHENNLGQYIPLAEAVTPPVGTPPTGTDHLGATVAADYYELATVEYTEQLHSDLPKKTRLRGYVDIGNGKNPADAHYLGATILAYRDKPVRIKMKNSLSGGLFLPLDTSYMGAGFGPPVRRDANQTLCTAQQVQDDIQLSAANKVCERLPYSQDRIAIHLHGGHTPWISDGTPYQWFTPAAVQNNVNLADAYKTGASFRNVPDMLYDPSTHAPSATGVPNPGPGFQTLYYTNQQSGRLMFYHDHAFGTTRLNVYSGMAAGYLLVDRDVEDPLIDNAPNLLPGSSLPAVYRYGIPLVIQDKTFVPQNITVQDTKWAAVGTNRGVYGDLWMPHVLETNQDPYATDNSGANNFGRWDFAPWFWPPTLFCNQPDAPQNLCIDLYNPKSPYPGQPAPEWDITATPEAFMDTPLVNGTAYPFLDVAPQTYRFRILSAGNDRPVNLQMYVSDPTSLGNFIQPATGMPTEVAMVPAVPRPICTAASPAATTDVPSTCTCDVFAPLGCFPPTWPTDGRDGGVPDPQFAGPKFIQIANEAGWLPTPMVIDNQPISFEYNRRNIVVLDVLNKSLLLAPAERADVLVDFSAFAGKTIILYNDAPAPMPAFDVRYDYFTNAPDQMSFGGAPPTAPGYGPNTRTIMQFRVAAAAVPGTNTPPYYDPSSPKLPLLNSAIANAFNNSQPKPIVPEVAYGATSNIYSTISNNSLTFTPVGDSTETTVWFQPKAIQELWDPFGRMNATLGVELPKTNNTTQTTIPLGYGDPVTENVYNNGVQIWKVTHNGVDTHPVHIHLTDVQVINRVGWDGGIRPPDANEVGWRETIKMKPLEDVIIALRPSLPSLPFSLTESSRLLDTSEPAGATLTLTSPVDGNPIPVTNDPTNFGYEFVWHCHILGHEENDFMRPLIFNAQAYLPPAPILAAPTADPATPRVFLTWAEGTIVPVLPVVPGVPPNYPSNGYLVQRDDGAAGAFTTIATVMNGLTYTDTTVSAAIKTYRYQIIAFNANGSVPSNIASITTPGWNLTTITLQTGGTTTFTAPATINLTSLTGTGAGVTISRVDYYLGTQRLAFRTVAPYAFDWTGVFPGSYVLTAHATDSTGAVVISAPVTVTVNASLPVRILETLTTYNTIQDAYNAVLTGQTIQVQAGTDTGTLVANIPGIDTTIVGGYDAGFATNLGTTYLHSKATVSQGSIRIQNIKIIP